MAPADPFRQKVLSTSATLTPGGTGQLGLESFISAATREMIGLDPPPGVARFRRDNPYLGLATQLGGLLTPYGAWVGVSRLPAFANRINKIGQTTAEARPFATAAKRELATWVPFEAGRVGLSAALGGDVTDTTWQALTDLGLFGGIAGTAAVLKAAGPRAKAMLTPAIGEDLRAPIQHQMRTISDAINSGKVAPAALPDVQLRLRDLGRAVRLETPGTKVPFVRGNLTLGGDATQLDRAFKLRTKRKTLLIKRFFSSTASFDFRGEPAWRKVAQDFGLPNDFEQFGQFFRYLEATNAKGRGTLDRTFKGLQDVGDGWKLTREGNDGLYVLGRRIGDKAVLFKTDTPGKFVPAARSKWADLVTARSAWLGSAPKTSGAQLYDNLLKLTETVPMVNYLDDLARHGRPREASERALGKLGIDLKSIADKGYATDLKAFANRYLAPAQLQFRGVPRFRWIQGMLRAVHDQSAARRDTTLFGKLAAGGDHPLWKDLVQGHRLEGGLIPQIKALDDAALSQLWTAHRRGFDANVAEKMGMQPSVVQLLKDLQKHDTFMAQEILQTQKATGQKVLFQPLAGHLGIGRTWKGEYRSRVYDEQGKLIFVGSGHTPEQAANEAQAIIQQARDVGREWSGARGALKDATAFLAGRERDLGLMGQVKWKDPGYEQALRWQEIFISKRRGPGFLSKKRAKPTGQPIGGFIGQYAPWDKDELAAIIQNHVTAQEKYLADISARHILHPEMTKLREESADAYNALTARFRDLAGEQGAFSQSVNAAADRLLGPYLGKNSASKIVANTNKVMFHWTQGMGQIGFNVLNALTFLQTGLGQAAYVMSGAAGKRGWAYTWWQTAGADGLPRGPMGVLDPVKFAWKSMSLLGKPDAAFRKGFSRAAVEGVTDPRFAEEFVGAASEQAVGLKQALTEGHLVKWIGDVSKWMPATTEKFARGHSFATGWLIGRDFMQIADEEILYRFAKEFTNNTMYLYSVADRARIITGPLGSAFGLWKNWQMHYMGWWLEYMGEFKRGNWSPLLWSVGGTAATAGFGGLPLYVAADNFAEWASGKGALEHIYDMYHGVLSDEPFAFDPSGEKRSPAEIASDITFMGLPSLFGVSLQGSGSGPFADPARDASMLATFPYWNRMVATRDFLGQAYDHWLVTGEHPINSPGVRDQLVRAFAPKTMFRLFAAVEEDYLKSLATGHPRQRDVGWKSKMLYTLGLTPAEVERHNAVAEQLWGNKEDRLNATRAYGKAYFEAVQARDWRAVNEILRRAVADEVDINSIIRSYKARESRHQQDLLEAQFRPEEVLGRFRNVLR